MSDPRGWGVDERRQVDKQALGAIKRGGGGLGKSGKPSLCGNTWIEDESGSSVRAHYPKGRHSLEKTELGSCKKQAKKSLVYDSAPSVRVERGSTSRTSRKGEKFARKESKK